MATEEQLVARKRNWEILILRGACAQVKHYVPECAEKELILSSIDTILVKQYSAESESDKRTRKRPEWDKICY